MSATLIPAGERHHWANEWLTSDQSFPGTGNYDLFGNAHGVLVMHNDDVVDPGEGLDAHQHQNMEILTWVLEGAVAHRDSAGNKGVLRAGTLGAMTAGRGITHAEGNASTRAQRERLRVLQMWVAPDRDGLDPDQSHRDFRDELASGRPVVVASGRPEHADTGALPIHNRFAALHIATPELGATVELPPAPYGHLYVARGAVTVDVDGERYELAEGDALRTVDAGPAAVTVVRTADDTGRAEIVNWEMHAAFDLVPS